MDDWKVGRGEGFLIRWTLLVVAKEEPAERGRLIDSPERSPDGCHCARHQIDLLLAHALVTLQSPVRRWDEKLMSPERPVLPVSSSRGLDSLGVSAWTMVLRRLVHRRWMRGCPRSEMGLASESPWVRDPGGVTTRE